MGAVASGMRGTAPRRGLHPNHTTSKTENLNHEERGGDLRQKHYRVVVFSVRCRLLQLETTYCMDEQTAVFHPVIFGTLTQPNATEKQMRGGYAGSLHLEELESFIHRLAIRTRCHLRVDVGWEDSKNQHSHIIVWTNDLNRWSQNLSRFDPSYAWRWRELDWQDFDPNHEGDCFSYVREKHQHIVVNACPGRQHRCRRGKCPHKP